MLPQSVRTRGMRAAIADRRAFTWEPVNQAERWGQGVITDGQATNVITNRYWHPGGLLRATFVIRGTPSLNSDHGGQARLRLEWINDDGVLLHARGDEFPAHEWVTLRVASLNVSRAAQMVRLRIAGALNFISPRLEVRVGMPNQ